MNLIVAFACVLRGAALLNLLTCVSSLAAFVVFEYSYIGPDSRYNLVSIGVSAVLSGALWIYAGDLSPWVIRAEGVIADGLRAGALLTVLGTAPYVIGEVVKLLLIDPDTTTVLFVPNLLTRVVLFFGLVLAAKVAVLFCAHPIGRFLERKYDN